MNASPCPDGVAERLEQASTLVRKARTVADAEKAWRAADATQRYARRNSLSQEVIDEAHKIRIRSMTLLGKYLGTIPRNEGAKGNRGGRGNKDVRSPEGTAHRPTLKELGLTKKESSASQFLAKLEEGHPDLHEAVLDNQKSIKDARWEVMVRHHKDQHDASVRKIKVVRSFPVGPFTTIVIDPPWTFDGDSEEFGASRHSPNYPLMADEKLRKLPVGDLADGDAHIYLWATRHSLWRGRVLLEHWGFRYVDILTWVKPSFGNGSYFRGQTEFILFGIKGSLSLLRKDIGTWFKAPRGPGGHSSKPEEFYDLVESCSPGPYVELFARRERPGWIVWGADAPTDPGADASHAPGSLVDLTAHRLVA